MSLEHINIKILDARVFSSNGNAIWAVHLYVGNEFADATGLAFLEPHHVELRFDALPLKVKSGFLPQKELDLSWEDNKLSAITGSSSISGMVLENVLVTFLNNCIFCLSPISSSSDASGIKRAVSYLYKGREYRIKNKGPRK